MVRLPFKTTPPIPIGETEHVVRRSFLSNESRLTRQSDLAKAYQAFMREYEELNHLERIDDNVSSVPQTVYFPHHATIKEAS